MRLYSIYQAMEDSAKCCPENETVKLFLRHSIRFDIPEDDITKDVSLTPEGRQMARRFGASLGRTPVTASASLSSRCIETAELILAGYVSANPDVSLPSVKGTPILQSSYISDHDLCMNSFMSLGPHRIIDAYMQDRDIPGFHALERSVDPLLDFIFSQENNVSGPDSGLELFVSHDFQIAMMLVSFFGSLPETPEYHMSSWPHMLEGLFLWGGRDRFHAAWRGRVRDIRS
ncbi:MAG: histidine phosphatase family protein [Spirochaetaceae bacterium]|jgi:hypothetical protein|nr:histidine phosphatase family protein [Spirochaetaceae bacterium]